MRLYGLIMLMKIIETYSFSKITVPQNDDEPLTVAAVNIVKQCFGSSERWSELLIISDHFPGEILKQVHEESMTSNLIASLDNSEKNDLTRFGKSNDTLWPESKPYTTVIVTHGVEHLESLLSSLNNVSQEIWRPRSNFLIILDTNCNAEKCNKMLKVIWNNWILNAVILCSRNDPVNHSRSEIELYTFNPYSAVHSQKWKTIIHEIIVVPIAPGNFNHSWYMFKQKSTLLTSSEDCRDIFFDKTSNLDGYVIPISTYDPELSLNSTKTGSGKWLAVDVLTLRTIAEALQFNVVQVLPKDPDGYLEKRESAIYTGLLENLYTKRSHLAPTMRGMMIDSRIEMTYPHDRSGLCFASRIVGNRPQWANFADAKHGWVAFGLSLLFSTLVLYFQNKSQGIALALLDAERLMTGNSIIRTSAVTKHRIILGSIFLAVLVVDGAIRGRFISALTVVRPYRNLDTIDQLKKQQVVAYGHESIKPLMTDSQIKARLKFESNMSDCLDRLERGEHQRACFTDCKILVLLTSNLSVIHITSTPVYTSYVTFFTAIHWPMTDRYSSEVHRLLETGISNKWRFDIRREIEINGWNMKRAEKSPYVRPTELNNLLPAFVLFFVGLTAGLFAFVWETRGLLSTKIQILRSFCINPFRK